MKKAIKIAALILALILAFGINNTVLIEQFNSSAMYGSLKQKIARANSIGEQEKFIIIGGSASNLGFDSEAFEKLSGKPAVNLAVSAGIPLRIYMKAAENCANAGDVIIMPLEYGYYSQDFYRIDEAYVDAVAVDPDLKCKETFLGSIEYHYTNFLRSFSRLNDCLMFALKEGLNTANTIYIADSVDEYGDFCLHENREATYVRVVEDISFTYDIETFREINNFIEKMKEKDVTVYLSYPVFDLFSIKEYEIFYKSAQKTIEKFIPSDNIIGTPLDFAHDEDYFFDTSYHIKYENREEYTEDLFRCYEAAVHSQKTS